MKGEKAEVIERHSPDFDAVAEEAAAIRNEFESKHTQEDVNEWRLQKATVLSFDKQSDAVQFKLVLPDGKTTTVSLSTAGDNPLETLVGAFLRSIGGTLDPIDVLYCDVPFLRNPSKDYGFIVFGEIVDHIFGETSQYTIRDDISPHSELLQPTIKCEAYTILEKTKTTLGVLIVLTVLAISLPYLTPNTMGWNILTLLAGGSIGFKLGSLFRRLRTEIRTTRKNIDSPNYQMKRVSEIKSPIESEEKELEMGERC